MVVNARFLAWAAPWVLALAVACSSSSGGGQAPAACDPGSTAAAFADGTDGHADPFGAKAAGQARAGRIHDASQIVQPGNGRSRVRMGDFVLANDKIALYVSSEVRGDGYVPFGGKILAIEPVGDDGKPAGASLYGESMLMLGDETVSPKKVSVLADGSDGKEAIVRAEGVLDHVPFLKIFRNLLEPAPLGYPIAFDYVLAPGAEHVKVRVTIANTSSDDLDLSSVQHLGFFHDYRAQTFTEEAGFDEPHGNVKLMAWDGPASFLVRSPQGPLSTTISVSGAQILGGPPGALSAPSCKTTTFDYADIVSGGPGIDGLLEARRRADGEPAWRTVTGSVADNRGTSIGGALVHATKTDGTYLSRAASDANGKFTIHVPPGPVDLTPTAPGYELPPAKSIDDATNDNVVLVFAPHERLTVSAKDAASGEILPARVQVIPMKSVAPAPKSFGVPDAGSGRLYQAFTTTGSVDLDVPQGMHRVVVTRGYEYEVSDQTIDVNADMPVVASLARTVDSTGIMCADFHIHSYFSVDAHDVTESKVKSAIADGLEIPVSSEHEWILDFQPIIERLGLQRFAYGFPSEELTTFEFGHFGVIPIQPDPAQPNLGAVDWIGKSPAELFHAVKTRSDAPVLIVNHPSKGDFQSYFSSSSFDRATAKGTPGLWSEEFDAIEVFNDSDFESNRSASVADWFALLNAGKTFSAVGSSDSHHIKTTPVGYPRTCFVFGHDDPTKLSAEIVRDAVKAGSATISGGLLMTTVAGPDGAGPGGTSKAGSYHVVVRSPSWIEAASLEVIVDGQTAKTVPLTSTGAGPGHVYDVTVDVQPASSAAKHWVVFHAKGPDNEDLAPLHPGFKPFAVSNPIWF